MREIPIYLSEKKDGLSDAIKAQTTVACLSKAEIASPIEYEAELAKGLLEKSFATNQGQIDLHYFKSILVTTGWNKNSDVFDRAELWAARSTPEDKPVNYMHDETDIIGHMTSCYPTDMEGKVLSATSAIDALPEQFHICNGAVLYKHLADKPLKERMEKIIAELKEGDWYVSMECVFPNFDYAVIDGEGVNKVIARNEETSFLTKHLRAYGGTGKYEGMQVGRLLRNYTFSGVALVNKPANPHSVIFDKVSAFVTKNDRITPSEKSLGYNNLVEINKESIDMAETSHLETEVKELKGTKAELQAEIKRLETLLKENDSKAVAEKIAGFEGDLKAKAEKVTALETQLSELHKSVQEYKVQLEAKTAELTIAQADLAKIHAVEVQRGRIAHVVGHFEDMDDTKAGALVERLAKLDNTEFESVVAAMPGYKDVLGGKTKDISNNVTHSTVTPVKKPGAPVNPPMTNSPISEANPIAQKVIDNKGTASTETETSTAALANAEPEKEAALAVATATETELEGTRADIVAFFSDETEQDN